MFKSKVNSPLVILLAIIVAGILILNLSDEPVEVKKSDQKSFNIQSWKTKNGSKVMFVHAKELPMVDIRVVFDAGSARDGDQPGLASMTNLMLDQGAGKWNTDEIAERLDSIGAHLGLSSLRDMAVVSLRSLTDEALLYNALDTFTAVLHKPAFPEADFERERKQVLLAIRNKQQSPDEIASDTFYRALYGKHPYGSPSIGTNLSVKKMSTADMRRFHQQYYVAANAVIAIVGDLDEKQARAVAERLSDGLESGKAAPKLAKVKPLTEPHHIHKTYPSSQTHVLVGQPGMIRGDKDYFPLYVGNHILGGSGFGSRIVEEIREKRGLAYSSYSYFLSMREQGPFIMGLQTANKNTEQALSVLRETLTSYIKEGPTAEELDHAKQNITGGFALRIDSNKDIVQYLAMIGFYDLPLDYLQSFNDKVMAVTVTDIQQAFAKRIKPDQMVTVLVGDLKPAK